MSTTNEELQKEVQDLKKRVHSLELDIELLKSIRVADRYYPVNQPWVAPVAPPAPYWQNPIITYCRS